ncbi:MAG: response regulator transcription factor [Gammaproteobacteria bacterium]
MSTIIIADDHAIFRAGLAKLLQEMPDVKVVGEASGGREAVELAEMHHPDIVIMDLAMSDMNGLHATAQIHTQHADIRVIILSMYANDEYVHEALAAGATGYVLKEATPDELRLAVETVTRGGTYLSSAVSKRVIEEYIGHAAGSPNQTKHLTHRHMQILHLMSEGKDTKEIALELGVSYKTLENHRTEIKKRLGIPSAAGLIRYAARLAGLPNR